MNWKYIEEFDAKDYYGFIYLIKYEDGTKYIGKKSLWTERRLKPRKTDRANAKRIVVKESNWRLYNGSTKLSKGKTISSKHILKLCKTKTDLTYWETYYLMLNNVLFDSMYLNQNVMGKFYCSEHLTGSKEYIKESK